MSVDSVQSFNQLLLKLSYEYDKEGIKKELNKYNFSKIIPLIVDEIVNCSDQDSRIIALRSLYWISDSSVLGKLKNTLLNDDNITIRIGIIEYIGYLKEESMLPTLNKLVNREDNTEIIRAASIAIQVIQGITPKWSMDY